MKLPTNRAEQVALYGNFMGVDYAKDQISQAHTSSWTVTFIRLKRAISIKFVQLIEFGDSDLEHSYRQTSQKKKLER